MVSSVDSFDCTDGGSLWITTFRLLGQLGTRVGCSGFWGAGNKRRSFFFFWAGAGVGLYSWGSFLGVLCAAVFYTRLVLSIGTG